MNDSHEPGIAALFTVLVIGGALGLVFRFWLTRHAVRRFPNMPLRRLDIYVTLVGYLLFCSVLALLTLFL